MEDELDHKVTSFCYIVGIVNVKLTRPIDQDCALIILNYFDLDGVYSLCSWLIAFTFVDSSLEFH